MKLMIKKEKYMKYNGIIRFLIVCAILAGGISCSDELDIKPTAEVESEYFETELRIQEGVAACYAGLTNIYGPMLYQGGSAMQMLFLPGDDLTFLGNGAANMESFSGLSPSNGHADIMWSRYYRIIFRCNFMLEKIEEEDIKAVYKTDGLYEANKGELLFLRAWCFHYLWDFFRKAPIQDKRIHTIPDAILPPSEGFEMLDKAIADLEEAALLLPNESYWEEETERGRVFNESAYGLLTRCYVLRARYNSASNEDYQKAITAFEKIKTRRLVHFADNFDYHLENNKESLFEFQASYAINIDNPWLTNDFGPGVGQMSAGYHYNTNHWSHDANSGIFGPTEKLQNAYEDGDSRKNWTFAPYTTNIYGDLNEKGEAWDNFNGYQLMKYVTPGRCTFGGIANVGSSNNTRLIRYGDVKLLAAEAYLKTGSSDKALQQVNDIRKRARESTEDGSLATAPVDLTSVTMKEIMHERFIELAAESGIRWMDLRSWHAAGYINLSTWTATDFGHNLDDGDFEFEVPTHLLFPIPQREMETNPLMAASGNNPGY